MWDFIFRLTFLPSLQRFLEALVMTKSTGPLEFFQFATYAMIHSEIFVNDLFHSFRHYVRQILTGSSACKDLSFGYWVIINRF